MFSVVIPVYNKAETVPMTLRSVLAQTVTDYEVILVDDGSTDSLVGAVEPFLADKRIRMIRQQNGGVSVARNTGIAAAQRPYICFLDADDEWLPNHLEVLRQMIESHPGAGLYCTANEISYPDGNKHDSRGCFLQTGTVLVPDFFAYTERLCGRQFLHTSVTCVRKEAAVGIGGYEPGIRVGEDTDFAFRMAAYHAIVLNDTVTGVYHREYSTATKDGLLAYDWIFEKREAALLADERIAPRERACIYLLLERFRIHKCRHYLLEGNRKAAQSLFRSLGSDAALRKERVQTQCMMLLPGALLGWVYTLKKSLE